jgi:hypothetical protein
MWFSFTVNGYTDECLIVTRRKVREQSAMKPMRANDNGL